jgi:hypothetical protein
MIGLSGFDLWQSWLLAALAFAWAGILLAARLPAPHFLARIHRDEGKSRKAVLPEPRA